MAHVRIADDNDDISQMLANMIRANGFEVSMAANPLQLTYQLENKLPDLVLMDILPGGWDGRELCKQLKKDANYKEIPMIVLSASHHLPENYKSFCAGDTLDKPFEMPVLIEKINRLLI